MDKLQIASLESAKHYDLSNLNKPLLEYYRECNKIYFQENVFFLTLYMVPFTLALIFLSKVFILLFMFLGLAAILIYGPKHALNRYTNLDKNFKLKYGVYPGTANKITDCKNVPQYELDIESRDSIEIRCIEYTRKNERTQKQIIDKITIPVSSFNNLEKITESKVLLEEKVKQKNQEAREKYIEKEIGLLKTRA